MATAGASLISELASESRKSAAEAVGVESTKSASNRRSSRVLLFAESVYEMFNPNTPGKAEMRNCDDKYTAMMKDRPSAS
jgi:hypothetical protein